MTRVESCSFFLVRSKVVYFLYIFPHSFYAKLCNLNLVFLLVMKHCKESCIGHVKRDSSSKRSKGSPVYFCT